MECGIKSTSDSEPCVQILEIAHLLQKKFALLPGVLDKEGHPCLILNDDFRSEIVIDHEFYTVIDYLTKIGREIWPGCKYSVIIDRRADKWLNVKTILEKLSNISVDEFVQLLVIKPKGFFQKHFYASTPAVLLEAAKHHKLFILDSLNDLKTYVEADNIPEGFGGQFEFDHMEWIEHKTAIERFELTCRKTEIRMKQLNQLFCSEIPLSSIDSIKEMANHQQKLVCDIEDDIKCSQDISETLTTLVEKPFSRKGQSALSQYNITCLKKWTTYLQTMRDSLDSMWNGQDKKLEESLSLCQFEEEFCSVSKDILLLTATLQSRTDVGEGLDACKILMYELDDFRDKSMAPYERMRTLREKGYAMIFTGHYLVQSVKMRCDEIKRLSTEFDAKLQARRELLQTSIDVFVCLDQLHAWCKTGVDLLASQDAGSFQTLDGATKGLREINQFLSSGKGLSMGKMNKINTLCKDLDNAMINIKVKEALARIDEVKDMITKRENSMKKVASKDNRPVQPVQAFVIKDKGSPEPSPKTPKEREKKRRGSQDVLAEQEKNNKSKTKEERKKSIEVILRKESPPSRRPTFRKSFRMRRNLRMTIDMGEDDPAMVKKRGLIMKEMIDTERVYVNDLQCIIEGYYNAYDEDEDDIPPHLHGMKDVIFGNIKEIYEFHKTVFLKELENCQENPQQIGESFLSKKEEFQFYATYCKNKPTSEALREDLSSSPFLSSRQAKLGHQLPLDAYLLKPVQRITKYQLLIGEMMKNTNKNLICYNELRQAVDAMKKVLRHVNDVMHSSGLTGYLGNMEDEGKLLLQDAFVVWEVQKKVLRQISNLRGKQRQLFLFEKSLIFSKRDLESGAYIYKGSLKTQSIGLTETVKGDPNKFEIRVQGRSNVYIIQAPSQEVKEVFVVEVRKLLLKQFDSVKENVTVSPKSLLASPAPKESHWRSSAPDIPALSSAGNHNDTADSHRTERKSPMASPLSKLKFRPGHMTPLAQENRSSSDYNIGVEKSSLLGESDDEGWSEGEFDNEDEDGCATGEENAFRYDSETVRDMTHSVTGGSIDSELSVFQSDPPPMNYWAIADYTAVDENEMSLVGGEVFRLVHKGEEGWLFVESQDGSRKGWAPASYLETVTDLTTPTSGVSQVSLTDTSSIASSPGSAALKPKVVKPKRETAV